MTTDPHETTTADAELASLRAEWGNLGGQAELVTRLTARAGVDGRRMWRDATAEVMGALGSTSVVLWATIASHGSLTTVTIAAFVLLFNGAWLTHFFLTRADLFRASTEGLDAFVVLTRKRLAAEERWTRASLRWQMVVALFLLPWFGWVFVTHLDLYRAEPWRVALVVGVFAAVVGGLRVYSTRKGRRLRAEAARFEQMVADAALE